jgi:hypothetical protein
LRFWFGLVWLRMQTCDPHHLWFAQPRAIGLKGIIRQLHQTADEVPWWDKLNINAFEIAERLWEQRLVQNCTWNELADPINALANPIFSSVD